MLYFSTIIFSKPSPIAFINYTSINMYFYFKHICIIIGEQGSHYISPHFAFNSNRMFPKKEVLHANDIIQILSTNLCNTVVRSGSEVTWNVTILTTKVKLGKSGHSIVVPRLWWTTLFDRANHAKDAIILLSCSVQGLVWFVYAICIYAQAVPPSVYLSVWMSIFAHCSVMARWIFFILGTMIRSYGPLMHVK